MPKRTIEDIVTELVLPIVGKYSFELVDVEFVKEGAGWYLRVYIDKAGGVTLDDCQAVSEELGDEMDRVDPIKQSYFLEVSSPGIERPLKKDTDFEKYRGSLVEIKVFQPVDGRKLFEGELVGLIDDKIVIRVGENETMEFEKDKVALVKRVIKF